MPSHHELTVFRGDRPHDFEDRSDAAIFTGGTVEARSAALVAESVAGMVGSPAQASLVRFDAGAHTRWHTHAGDQILVITEGRGHVGTTASDVEVVAGDIVVVPAGSLHYHGASESDAMAHLTLLFGSETTVHDISLEWPPNKGQA